MPRKTRERAELLLSGLQKHARELLAAQEGLVRTVRHLVEERGLAPSDVKKRLEDVLGRVQTATLWSRLKGLDASTAFNEAKDGVERRMEDTVQRFIDNLPVASKTDLKAIEGELNALKRRVDGMKRIKGRAAKNPKP